MVTDAPVVEEEEELDVAAPAEIQVPPSAPIKVRLEAPENATLAAAGEVVEAADAEVGEDGVLVAVVAEEEMKNRSQPPLRS